MRITCFHAVVLRKTPSSKKTGKWDKLYVTPGADARQGWAAQTTFLQTEIGDAYLKTLATNADQYIQTL